MRYLTFFGLVAALIVSLMILISHGQDAPLPPERRAAAKGASSLETCMKRGVEAGKLEARVRKTELVRCTSMPDGQETDRFLVVLEFKDGSFAVFQGGTEQVSDQFVVIFKSQVPLVLETVCRLPEK